MLRASHFQTASHDFGSPVLTRLDEAAIVCQ
jgi:hypothetical protein